MSAVARTHYKFRQTPKFFAPKSADIRILKLVLTFNLKTNDASMSKIDYKFKTKLYAITGG